MRAISFSALVILVIAAIAALAEEPQYAPDHVGFPPSGYVSFYGIPAR
ncbi:MAG: hypothetical protein WA510_17650 [Acidobacteriaceae bacterium]